MKLDPLTEFAPLLAAAPPIYYLDGIETRPGQYMVARAPVMARLEHEGNPGDGMPHLSFFDDSRRDRLLRASAPATDPDGVLSFVPEDPVWQSTARDGRVRVRPLTLAAAQTMDFDDAKGFTPGNPEHEALFLSHYTVGG